MGYTQDMQMIHVIAAGGAQEAWQNVAISQYLERIRPFARVEVTEIPDERESATVPVERIRAREGEAMRKRLKGPSILVALDEGGRQLDSREWAGFLEKSGERGVPVVFLLGGANGLDPALRQEADYVLSLGKQTMPHVLARIVLLEQLYRAQAILRGKAYHR